MIGHGHSLSNLLDAQSPRCRSQFLEPVSKRDDQSTSNRLASILKTLQHEPADLFHKARWEWDFLCLLGVQPQLDVCLISGQPLPPDFLPSEQVFYQLDARLGGIRSPGHTEPSPDAAWLSSGTVIGLRRLAVGDLQWQPTKLNLRELHKAFLIYLRFHLGREPKSHRLIPIR